MEHVRIKSIANSNLLNTINISIILHYVRDHGASYRSEMSKALNLSLPAVSRAVNQLIKKDYLVEKRIITATGKQAHEVEINASFGIFVGISIELPAIKFSRMDMAGNILDIYEAAISSDTANLEEFVLERLHLYLQKTYFHNDTPLKVLSVCLALPAAIDQKKGKINAVLFQRLNGINLQTSIEKDLQVPVLLENNENLAALAEKYYQEGSEEDILAFITIHQGIGAGLIVNGQLYRGANGAAGEIGYQHLKIVPNHEAPDVELYEKIASISQIQRIAINLIQAGKGEDIFRAANYTYSNIDHILLGKLAAAGSEDAIYVLKQYAEVLAFGLSNFLVTMNPETIILGGNVCDIENLETSIITPLKTALQRLIPFPVPNIRPTRLGREAIVIGASQYALENTILKYYPYILFDGKE